MPFHWRDHIKIKGFPPDVAARLAAALDGITAAHDGEGVALLRKATAHMPLVLEASDQTQGICDQGRYTLNLNIDQIEHVGWSAAVGESFWSGKPDARHASLTGILVHELYHAADTKTSRAYLHRRMDAALTRFLEHHGVAHASSLLQRFLAMYEGKNDNYPYSLLADAYGNRQATLEAFATHGYADIARMIAPLDPEACKALFQRLGFYDKDGNSMCETDAVHYTDAFMRKNFGDAEPQRKSFQNEQLMAEAEPLRILAVDAHAHNTSGFVADADPAVQATLPRIRPVHTRKAR